LSSTIEDYLSLIYVLERDGEPVVGTHLTGSGWQSARTVMRRHMLMEWMMVRMLPWSKLHSEAHHLEHAVSSMTEATLMEELNHPQTCPHGNSLPGCEEAVASWIRLTEIPKGETVTIRRIHQRGECISASWGRLKRGLS
jgi:DtxR family Mn-dependent transcriptional regulator